MVTTLAIIASLIVALKDRNANGGSWRLYFSLSRKTHFLAFLWQIKNKKRIFYIGDYYKRISDIMLLRSFSNVGNSWPSSQKLNDKCDYNVIIIIIITLLLALCTWYKTSKPRPPRTSRGCTAIWKYRRKRLTHTNRLLNVLSSQLFGQLGRPLIVNLLSVSPFCLPTSTLPSAMLPDRNSLMRVWPMWCEMSSTLTLTTKTFETF